MSQINESTIKTPGVYVNEIPSFPPSIAQVATAIPAFIGYTSTDVDAKGNKWHLVPKRITSFLDYQQYFGGAQDETNITVSIVEHQTVPPPPCACRPRRASHAHGPSTHRTTRWHSDASATPAFLPAATG